MVVEHVFVTTMEAPAAMRAASELLAERGFVAADGGAFPMGEAAGWNSLKMTRGKATPGKARSVAQLPQVVRLDYDRGRVTVALSISPSVVWGGGSFYSEPKPTSKRLRLHRELLLAIAGAIEGHFARGEAAGQSATAWTAIEADIAKVAKRRKIRNWIVLSIVMLMFAGVIVLIMGEEYHWFRR